MAELKALNGGSDPADNSGSTAEIATWLGADVILIVNSRGLARSIAPLVKGFAQFDPSVKLAGVIANMAGSEGHVAWMRSALESQHLPALLGAVRRNSLPALPSRHLGLVTADEDSLPDDVIDQLADACRKHLDLDAIVAAAQSANGPTIEGPSPTGDGSVRIGVARDVAFHFTYPDNLEALVAAGAELVFFSPLADPMLPEDLAGIYLPGGYPELFADKLSQNQSMRNSIRQFGESGGVVYGECGGLMYLGQTIQDGDGEEHPMVGLAPVVTRKLDRLKTLGYVEASLQQETLWGLAGQSLRGHEFHYSEIVSEGFDSAGWQKVYNLRRRRSDHAEAEGFCRANTLISYVHLHWAAAPQAVQHFIQRCKEVKRI